MTFFASNHLEVFKTAKKNFHKTVKKTTIIFWQSNVDQWSINMSFMKDLSPFYISIYMLRGACVAYRKVHSATWHEGTGVT